MHKYITLTTKHMVCVHNHAHVSNSPCTQMHCVHVRELNIYTHIPSTFIMVNLTYINTCMHHYNTECTKFMYENDFSTKGYFTYNQCVYTHAFIEDIHLARMQTVLLTNANTYFIFIYREEICTFKNTPRTNI